jgi:peptide/nickel transport system substrate-binding protein
MQRRRPITWSTRSWVLLAVLAMFAATACGNDDDGAASPTTEGNGADTTETTVEDAGDPVQGGSITVGLEAETNSWLPGQGNFSNPGINVALAIYDPLLRRDANGDPTPYLAESIEANDDLDEWTLTLRSGVEFHDGTPLDAEALKTVFDDYVRADDSNLAGQVEDVESLDVVDELTVVYRLSGPNAAFANVLTGAVGWPFSPTAAAEAGADAGSRPVGTGPFMFDSWQRDNRLTVVRNENYWQEGLPYLDEIVFRPIPDEDTRISSLASGDIDVLQSLRQSAIVRARDVQGAVSHEHVGNNSGSAIFNTERAPLDDVRVRRALAYALDQDQLIDVLGGAGISQPQTQYFSEDSPFWSATAAEAWPTNDMDEAMALIDEYTSDPNRSDGKAAGDPVTFQFDCPPDPSLIELSQLYQAFWESIGVQVNLRQVEQATHINEALAGDFDAKCWRVSDEDDPYVIFSEAFGPGSPLNFTRFTDEVIDEQLQVLRTTNDIDDRQAAVETISLVLAENVPNTFTAGTLTTLAARDAVKNITGWVFPDGTDGEGVVGGTTMWGHVWLAR